MTSNTIKERVARWIDRSAWRAFQVLTSAALLALAAFVVAGEVDSQRALVALALLAVVAALAALRPSDLRELVGRLSEAGPLKFATGEAETAAAQSLGAEADEQGFEETSSCECPPLAASAGLSQPHRRFLEPDHPAESLA